MKNILIALFVLCGIPGFSQEKDIKDVSIDGMLNETQFSSDNPKMMEFVWWLPREFWEASYAQDPTSSEADYEELNKMFQDFELFGIIQGEIGHFGGITYYTKDTILKNLNIQYKGENLMVVSEEEISADFLNFLMIMQPMLGNMLGQMGNNIHFVLLKSIRGNEVLPINPLKSDELTIKLGDFEKVIDLPLSSLLMEKKCPEDEKLYSGKWTYCPIHGKKLISK
ncbi:hypothetical protein [Aequorivita vladivostokensis]|uniref:Uncharacterized protein n=1 Tax=Aequorivita vladivostokensis TaxID=171194 RepID=A0ABR5DFV2_9FLAO|nr:hypothetical protein [Aequorivita vladivostokensis]KJJ37640.1 hypothetical protein MB09_12810 [Aequorivita vladivostokensis]